METITLAVPEKTIDVEVGVVTKITNCASFQNISNYDIRWSSMPIDDANRGGVVTPGDGHIFNAGAREIYLHCVSGGCNVHVWSVLL